MAPTKPAEEFVEISFDDENRVPVERPVGAGRHHHKKEERKNLKPKKSSLAERLGADEDDDRRKERPKEPNLRNDDRDKARSEKFARDDPGRLPKGLGADNKDKKLNARLKTDSRLNKEAVHRLVKNEVLQTCEPGFLQPEGNEKTFRYNQDRLLKDATVGAQRKCFKFDLPYGPVLCDYSRNGQHLLTGGRKGQVALMHCETMKLMAEVNVKETVRAVKILHDHTMFAVAQRKYAYIYDQQGIELHCLKDQKWPTHIEFLPYHFLLVTAGEMADLHYRDTSTGQQVASMKTRLGPTRSMRANSRTGVMHLGHSNGTVTLWTPTVKEPVVKMLCHSGHVTALAADGNYMATAGADGYWKVWDLRKYEGLHAFKYFGHAPSDIDISMTGLIALGFGSHVHVWKDALSSDRPEFPYLDEMIESSQVSSVRFRPYEDVLAVGTSKGFGGLLVPGAGHANIDSFEANPFETKEQRKEKEIRGLLEKLQPSSIMLDPSQIGSINAVVVKREIEAAQKKADEEAAEAAKKLKKKMRGANKSGRRETRKQAKSGADQRKRTKKRIAEEGEAKTEKKGGGDDKKDGGAVSDGSFTGGEEDGDSGGGEGSADEGAGEVSRVKRTTGSALGRFFGKRQRKT